MSENIFASLKVAGKKRELNVRKDTLDIRDRMYEPSLIQLQSQVDNRAGAIVLDQGEEGACTGFGLAAVINLLYRKQGKRDFKASPRMLYEMAKKHDEWPGEDYAGSSCRGAIRGWKNMGVCSSNDWPYKVKKPGELTIEQARAARSMTIGAYYRLRPEVNHYHAAINEAGAVYVSADVHSGWTDPKPVKKGKEELAVIEPSQSSEGGHAFAIVGYNSLGFIVQNSWGKSWGSNGFSLWLYEDWLQNITDGWVFRLAVPTPQIFGLAARTGAADSGEIGFKAPKRLEIAGHFVHLDDGKFKPRGDYWSTTDDVAQTAQLIRKSTPDKYQHFLIYAHGGLNSPQDSARRIAALKDGFKRNGIYPFHIMYDTGIAEELKDAIVRAYKKKKDEGFFSDLRDKLEERNDELLEDVLRKPVTPLWDEMKRDARLPFKIDGEEIEDGVKVIKTFAEALNDTGIKIHLAGHSTGAVLLGHLLDALDALNQPELITSCSLMAPACSIDFYNEHYAPRLNAKSGIVKVTLPALDIYNLTEKLELDDNVVFLYRKSLLYLVSRALERQTGKPILGMQLYSKKLTAKNVLRIYYSDGKKGVTTSTSHGGFDNDTNTLNSIMTRILGKTPSCPFMAGEMKGY